MLTAATSPRSTISAAAASRISRVATIAPGSKRKPEARSGTESGNVTASLLTASRSAPKLRRTSAPVVMVAST
jgi:hypothetical protein